MGNQIQIKIDEFKPLIECIKSGFNPRVKHKTALKKLGMLLSASLDNKQNPLSDTGVINIFREKGKTRETKN